MKLGIVGLPNVGKSTLFNALTQAGAESANYPFCTIEPNVGVVTVPDERLYKLATIYPSERPVPTAIEFCDIAGLVEGASDGEGLGNQFLSHIREVDAIVHVVRCFENPDIVHIDGEIDPIRDIEIINLELMLSDMELLERRLERVKRAVKGDKKLKPELDLIEKVIEVLENGKSIRTLDLSDEEKNLVKSFNLLSSKPVVYVANISEDDLINNEDSNPYVEKVEELAEGEDAEVITVSAEIESQISQLDDEEKIEFLESLGLKESGLDKLIRASYKLLGLISFFTAGPKESRAWTIKEGTPAPQAAGRIHSDMERGFIRAEVIAYEDLIKSGNMVNAKEKGLVRVEGKDYIMNDGDVVLFRFNV